MIKGTKDYRLLLAGIIVFYVILTFKVGDFNQLGSIGYIKLGLGFSAAFYLLFYSLRRPKAKGKQSLTKDDSR